MAYKNYAFNTQLCIGKSVKMKTGINLLFSFFVCLVFFEQQGRSQCTTPLVVNAGANATRCSYEAGVPLGGTPTASGGNGTYSYNWSPSTGLSCTNCANPVSNAPSTTTYTLTVTDPGNACPQATAPVTVTVPANPVAAFTFSPASGCANVPVQFTNTSTGSGLAFAWNFGDPASGTNNTSTQMNPAHTFSATGSGTQSFTVTLTVTNASGCQASVSQTVTVKQIPDPGFDDFTSNTPFVNCGSQIFNLTIESTSSTSASNMNYAVSWGDGSPDYTGATFPAAGLTHTYSALGYFTLVNTVTGSNGCTATYSHSVYNGGNPAVGLGNPGSTVNLCLPNSLTFPITGTSNNPPGTIYTITSNTGVPPVVFSHPPPASYTHTFTASSCGVTGANNPNSFFIRIKAENPCGFSESTVEPITTSTKPAANFTISPSNVACTNTTLTFTNTSINGIEVGTNLQCNLLNKSNWTISPASGWNVSSGSLGNPNPTNNPTSWGSTSLGVSFTAPGTYSISMIVRNACGNDTMTKTVCIENPPVPNFTLSQNTGCIPFTTQTTNTSTTANTCNVTRNWSVIFNGSTCSPTSGSWSFAGGTNASSVSPQFQFSSPGTYVIRLTLTNSCGSFQFDRTVTAQSVPQVSVTALSAICAGQSVSPSASVNDCYEPADTYQWTFTGGSPTTFSALTPGSVSYATAGSYTVTFQATNQCGSASANAPLTVSALPGGVNPTVNSPLCVGGNAQFSATTLAGVTYHWSGPNGFSSTLQNPQITNVTAANAGTYSVYATVGNCQGPTQTMNLVVNPLPTVNAGSDFAICRNAPAVTLTGTPSGGTWTGTGTTSGGTFTPSTAGTFSLTYTYTNPGGCSGSDIVVITVNPLPAANAGSDISLCNQPVATTLTGTPSGGTWSGTGITNPSGQFTPFSTGSFPVVYTITNAGCVGRDTMIINVVNPTNADAGPDQTICADAPNIQLTGAPSGGTWTGTGITSGGLFDPAAGGTFPMVYTFGTGSCLTRDTMRFVVNPLPNVNAGADFSVCENGAVSNHAGIPAGGTWTGTGITSAGVFNPAVAGAGTHTLTYTYTNPATGCTNTDNLIATVNAKPTVAAGPDLFLCNQPIAVNLPGTPSGGTWTGTGITNPAGEFTPSSIGTFTIVYTVTNANGCVNRDTVIVNVGNPSNASAGPDSTVCIDAANVQLTGTPSGGNWTGTGITSAGLFDPAVAGTFNLVYNVGSGTCISRDTMHMIVNPLPIVDAGANFNICVDGSPANLSGSPSGGTWAGTGISNPSGTFDPAVAGAGTFTLTYTYIHPTTHCQNSDVLSVTVNPLPTPNAGNDTILCNQPIGVTLAGTPSGGVWSGTNVTSSGVFTPSGTGTVTLTYTITAATGCDATDNVQIQVVNAQQANAGADQETCIFSPSVQLNGIPSGGTWSGTGITSAGVFTPNTAGNFSLVYTYGGGNCVTRDTMIYTVHALPTVNAGADRDFCLTDDAVDFTGNPLNGTWTGTGITNASTGTFDPGVAAAGNFNIVYSYTNPATTCVNRDTLVAIVHPLPVPDFTYNPIACANAPEIFTNTTNPGSTYAWDFGDGGSATATNPSHTYTSVGFFDVQLIATSAFGCVDSVTQIIEVREPPVSDFSISPDSSCAPVVVNFTNNASGIAVSYAWDFGNGTSSTLQNPPAVTYYEGTIADTAYNITLSVTNFCGTATHTEAVIAMPKPKSIFGTNFDVGCSPFTVEIANNSLGLPDTYFWDFGDGTTSSSPAALLSHVFTTGQSDTVYTIMLVVTNECGTDTSYHDITVLPNQVNAFFNTNITSGCVPLTVNFTQFSTGATTYNWEFGDGNTSNTFSPSHTFTTAGTFTVSLAVNDGCSFDTAAVDITVFPSPVVNFSSAPDSTCINEPFTFTNLSSGLTSTSWDFGDGQNASLANPMHTYTASGTYQVTLTGTSATNSCTASVTHPVVVSVNPVAAFAANPVSGCAPLQVSFPNTSTSTAFQTWTFGDGNSSTQFSPVHVFQNAGTYTVKLLVENANGCKDSVSHVVTVYPVPVADFTVSTTNACYSPVSVSTTNTSTGAVNYAWTFGNGNSSSLTNPTAVYSTPGTYTIQLTASNAYGCTSVHTETVTVYPTPSAALTISEDTICVGETITFTSQSSFADSVVWLTGDGNQLTGSQVTYQYGTAGTYDITVIAYGAGGCGDTLTLFSGVVVHPTPIAGFDYVNIQNPDPLSGTVEFTNTSIGADSYVWNFGNGVTSTEVNPIERYNAYGDFGASLIAINQFGCADTLEQLVIVDFFNGLFVPNAIYPGHPDFGVANFLPKGVGLATYEILIYDDWGNLIWESTALDADGRPTGSWDGKFNGEPVQQDAYVWKVSATFLDTKIWKGKEYPGGKFKKSGTVTVIR